MNTVTPAYFSSVKSFLSWQPSCLPFTVTYCSVLTYLNLRPNRMSGGQLQVGGSSLVAFALTDYGFDALRVFVLKYSYKTGAALQTHLSFIHFLSQSPIPCDNICTAPLYPNGWRWCFQSWNKLCQEIFGDSKSQRALLGHKLLWFCWRGGLCLLEELHWEASASAAYTAALFIFIYKYYIVFLFCTTIKTKKNTQKNSEVYNNININFEKGD